MIKTNCLLILLIFLSVINNNIVVSAEKISPVVEERSQLEQKEQTFLIAFAQDTMANDWRVAQVRELENELKKHDFIKFIYTNGKGKTSKSIMDIEDLISMKVDILIASPRDAVAMTPVISKAYEAGIPVILLSRKVEGEKAFTTFIHPDNKKIARKAAKYMAQRLNGKGKILILKGVPTSTTAIHRTDAFLEEIKKHKEIKVVAIKTANYLRSDAIRSIEETIGEGIKFDAIYAQSDSMASGARLALQKAGIDPTQLLIVGIDYISETREAIRQGEQDASFTYPTCGKEGANAALSILNGKSVPREIVVESQMITIDNIEAVNPIF